MNRIVLSLSILLMPTGIWAGQVKVKVKGLVCSFCAQGIIKQLETESSIAKIDVLMRESSVVLTPKDDAKLSDQRIEELIVKAGYSVKGIEHY